MEQREKVIGVHKELKELKGIKKIHFVGIGGAGMSPLAKMMVELGYEVSGSDREDSGIIEKLRQMGAKITLGGQKAENVRGVDAIVVCGTTGEASTLTPEEREALIRHMVAYCAGRCKVIAGVGTNSTAQSVRLARQAEACGADALLAVTPYYNKASQEGLAAHYFAIADAVQLPLIAYNVPSRTGVNLKPETCRLLSTHPRINGVKEAGGDISQVAHILNLCGEDFNVWSGNDDQIVPILALGGVGVISVLSNVAPTQTHEICQKFFDGDVAGSRQMQLDAMDLCNALFCEVNPIPVKKALNLMGWQAGPLRMPLTEMTEAHTAQLAKELEAFGIKLA